MNVEELIEMLKKVDQKLDVILVHEDEQSISDLKDRSIFVPIAVETTYAEILRLNDNSPALKYEKSNLSDKLCIIHLTSDF